MTRTLAASALAVAFTAAAADLPARIHAAIDGSPAARGAFWGVQIVGLESGRLLFEANPDRFFVPASNTKLFTAALGLARLGPAWRFQTTVLADRHPGADGAVGTLRLVGGGDPNLSARPIPYRMGRFEGDPLGPIDALAAEVVSRGVRRVDGDIVGDDSAYIRAPYPDGWAMDDAVWQYGAPVSALTVNDNAFSLSVRPGPRPGDFARLSLSPALEFYAIDNRVRTVAGRPRRILIDREPGSRQLRVWGVIPPGDPGETALLAVDDPALYAARALREALERRGVAVAGVCRARHVLPNEVEDLVNGPAPATAPGIALARRESAPLIEDLRVTAKVSQNLHAELILRAVARERRGIGSREAGLEEMRAFLDEVGVPREAYALHDGSGLARLNLVTPQTVVRLLRYMWRSSQREDWLGLLPVAGKDGTLSNRFLDSPALGRIRAKTGTLAHVAALAGYAENRTGEPLAFAILVNNYHGSAAEVRNVVDKICSFMVE
jgi:D-alanyl-D-alanine carboxypeptidase/D-alanyl-D-alanine-endopeptidase (penicillin-binding protein 4)